MNATMSALLQFHNDNTSKFYQDVVTALNRVSPAQREGTFTFNSDPMDIFDSGGALDTRAYKDYIKKQILHLFRHFPKTRLQFRYNGRRHTHIAVNYSISDSKC